MERFHARRCAWALTGSLGALLLGLAPLPAPGQTHSWTLNAAGQWTNAAAWTPAGVPDAVGAVAYLTNDITGNRAVTLNDTAGDNNITLGTLILGDGTHGFRFAATGGTTWTFDDTDGVAEISVVAASGTAGRTNAFNMGITFNDDLVVSTALNDIDAPLPFNFTVREGVAGRSFTKIGNGIVALNASNDWTGATIVAGGTLQINDANALPGGTGTTGGTSALILTNNGVLALGAGDFTRALGTGPSNVIWTGGGGFSASGADRFVNIGGDTQQLTWGSGGFVPDGANLVISSVANTHLLDFQNDIALGAANRTIQVNNGTAVTDGRLSGVLSGSGGITKTGAGALELTRTNTFTGGLTVSGGILLLSGGENSLATNGAITVTSGTLDLGGNGQTTDSAVSFQGGFTTNGTITKSGGDYDARAGTVAAILAGSAGLTKTGTGTFNLESNNTYSGQTTILGGTLRLRENGTLPTTSTNILINQATLTIEKVDGINVADRISDDAAITSRGGALIFTNDAAATTAYAETLESLDFGSGNTLIQITAAAPDGSSRLVFDNASAAVTRSGAGATARIEAPGLGTNAQAEILFAPGGGMPGVQAGGVIPWIVVKDGISGSGADYNLATTNLGSGGNIGITALTSYQQNPESIWIASDNVRPVADEALSGNRALNALVLDDGIDILGDSASANDRRLDFNTAGGAAVILQTGGTSLIERGTFSVNNDAILAFGNNQGIFHTIGTLQINRANSNEQIRGTNGFVKAGPGTLILDSVSSKDPTVANAMSGDFYINEGILELRRAGSGGATTLRLDGGDLRLASGADQNYGNNVIVDENGSIIVAHTNASATVLDMTLSNVTIAAGRTLTINRDVANFSAVNQNYRVIARDVNILGDAIIDVRQGKGTGDGTFEVDSVSDGGGSYDLTVIGNNVVRSQFFVNNTLSVGNLTIGNNALVRLRDGAVNVLGNVNLFGGLLGLNTNFTRELGSGAGQVQLTGDAGLQSGFSAFDNPITVRIEDGGGNLTNLVWGASDTFNPGILTLQQDDANQQLDFENSIDLNAAVSNVTRTINVHNNVAVISGAITNSGPFVADFVKGGAGTLWLTNGFHWDGNTRISGGFLRIPDVASLPSGNLLMSPANAVGVLETAGLFTRALGTNANEVAMVGGGNAGQNSRPGFSAFGGDLTVDIGGDGTGTGTQLVWNTENFDPSGPSTNSGALMLNSANANGTLRFMNDMDLNGEDLFLAGPDYRRIEVNAGLAVLGGDITNSQAGVNAMGLLKRGAGTLALQGYNTYDGLTEIAVGTLLVNGANTGGGAFNVAGGATLGGTGLISASILVNSNATLAPGSLGIGNLTAQGDVDIEGILSIEIDAAGAGFVDFLTVTGILDISSATLNFVTNGITLDDTAYIFASYGTLVTNDVTTGFGAVSFLPDGYQLEYNYLGGNQIALVIPEPTTWALLLLGGLSLLAAWRRRG